MATEVADGVFQLSPLPYVNVFAVRGGNGWTIVDAAVAPLAGRLVRGLAAIGVRPGNVERVVLTHGHGDHAGGAEAVRVAFEAREVLVGAADLPAVHAGINASGGDGSLLERQPVPLPGYPKVLSAGVVPPTLALDDDRTMVTVATPGHTDGHVAFHLPEQGVVLGGDTVFNVFTLTPSPGMLCSDAPRNLVSILALSELDPKVLLLAHGRPVHGDVRGKLRSIAHA